MSSFLANDRSAPADRPGHVSRRGRHIFVVRGIYTHHGIDRGDDTVIDFSGLSLGRGIDAGKACGAIRVVQLADFARGGAIYVRTYGKCDAPDVVVARAESKLGTAGYHLTDNNCEHFATWCMTGASESAQVQAALAVSAGFATHQLGPQLVRGTITGLGKSAPASAPNIMSGLKAIGGTSVGGIGVVAAAGAAAGAGTVGLALRDRPYITEEERLARRTGRCAGVGGAAIAAGGVIYGVGALGVPGFGAAGVSSGLAALGGGAMLAGLAVAFTAPVLAAWVLGIVGFVFRGWFEERAQLQISL